MFYQQGAGRVRLDVSNHRTYAEADSPCGLRQEERVDDDDPDADDGASDRQVPEEPARGARWPAPAVLRRLLGDLRARQRGGDRAGAPAGGRLPLLPAA